MPDRPSAHRRARRSGLRLSPGRILKPGGAFVAKVFQGGAEGELLAQLKRVFAELRHAKPPASRAESAETYVVAKGFRGRG